MSGRILIVDDVTTNRIILRSRLAPAAYDIVQATTAADMLKEVRAGNVDLTILPDRLADLDAPALCRLLRALPGAADLPVLQISTHPDRSRRLAALEAGVDAVLPRWPQDGILRARLRNLIRRHATDRDLVRDQADVARIGLAESAQAGFAGPGHIALIAPSLAEGLHWRNALAPLMRDRIEVLNPAHPLAELNRRTTPDVIVIADPEDVPGGALRLLSDLRCRNDTHRASIVMLQDRHAPGGGVMALDLGVSDLIEDGFDPVELALRLRRELARKTRTDRCRAALQDGLRMASTDPLTGLFNRRYALPAFRRILSHAQANADSIAVMVLDLDRFKSINDRFGHAAGDAVLAEVSRRLADCLRQGDLLARIGGEEFLAVIGRCDPAAARLTAERLRRVVSQTPVDLPAGSGSVAITMSIGLAAVSPCPGVPCDPADLIGIADRALYGAKAEGRDQVTVAKSAA